MIENLADAAAELTDEELVERFDVPRPAIGAWLRQAEDSILNRAACDPSSSTQR